MLLHPLSAWALTVSEPVFEGGLVYGTLNKGEHLSFQGQKIIPDKDGRFVFAVPQDTPNTLSLTTGHKKRTISIQRRHWDEEEITGLPPQTVMPNSKNQQRITQENKLIKDNRQFHTTDWFPSCFIHPVPHMTRISGTFGARRIYNGIKKGGHSGVDYAAPTGTPVLAPADGIVRVAHGDMFLTGKTILIDHGFGIYTSYSHLSEINIEENQTVKQGQQIGRVGTTGRSTGPHLHFVMSWFNVRVDPEQMIKNHNCFK